MAKSNKETRKEVKVSEKKLKMVGELADYIVNNNTIMISSIKGMPSSQFQSIRKKLKGKAVINVVKKNVMAKAIESVQKQGIDGLKDYLEEGSAVLFSQLDPFELAAMLSDTRIDARARAGQRAPRDIRIESGATDIPAGPMISELSNVGLKVGVDSGRITIKESAVIAKKDEKISEGVANILAAINILPFRVGLEPIAVYDSKENKIFTNIKINKEETLESIKKAYSNAFSLVMYISYPAREVIGQIMAKAARIANAITNLIKKDTQEKNIQENQTGG